MANNAAPLEKLIEEFAKFPGIGRKGATRMAYQVLSMTDEDAKALAGAIQDAHTRLHRCPVCQNFTEKELCPICAGARRDKSVICVVEKPRDVQAFERTREYHGLYHVLHGLISPMDGVGAEQLAVKELLARLKDGAVKEVIMAMNPTVEGEATAMYLAKLIKPLGIRTTRLAYGLPVGASLEYTDETTLYRALAGREKGGVRDGACKSEAGDQDHRHQPGSTPRILRDGSAGDRHRAQGHRGQEPAGRRGQPEGQLGGHRGRGAAGQGNAHHPL